LLGLLADLNRGPVLLEAALEPHLSMRFFIDVLQLLDLLLFNLPVDLDVLLQGFLVGHRHVVGQQTLRVRTVG